MTIMRRAWPLLAAIVLLSSAIHAQEGDGISSEEAPTTPHPPAVARNALEVESSEPPVSLIPEDTNFDPYDENVHVYRPQNGEDKDSKYQPKQRKVELFDFDPSEGLTFHVYSNKKECFYQDAKFTGDEISGAYVVSSADSHIDLEIKNPAGVVVYRRFGDAEGQYQVHPTEEGIHELCFLNSDSDGKLVTHVTNTLKSQHPVEREHVSVVAKYASHIDVRLGELESEQRLQHIRTDRFIKVEESTSQRVAFYGTLECFVYFLICLYQVLYIKGLLDGPRQSLPTRKTWA